jgi:hypothetical protein
MALKKTSFGCNPAAQHSHCTSTPPPDSHQSTKHSLMSEYVPITEFNTVLVKFVLDGFSIERFECKEAHFQFGYSIVNIGGVYQEGCNSKKALRPLAKIIGKEEVAIPLVMKHFSKEVEKLTILQAPDTSVILKLPGEGVEGIQYIKPVISADYKAINLILQRSGASSKKFCHYNLLCSQKESKTQVEKLASTTTMGDLRALAEHNCSSYQEWREWMKDQGNGYTGSSKKTTENSNLTTKDYEDAVANQKAKPLLPWVPDSVKLLTLIPIESLHAVIQSVGHRFDLVGNLAKEWGVENLENIPKDMNAYLEKRYKRPLLGFSEPRLWQMLTEYRTWVAQMLTKTNHNVFVNMQPQPTVVQHPRLELFLESMDQLQWLLQVLFSTQPTQQEIADFGDRALEHGHFMRAHFPEYTFKPYDHWIICHAWEGMEYFGGLGHLSSIVCESANAEWKYTCLHHEPGTGLKCQASIRSFSSKTNPSDV